ncbi:MAG TPA: hypothetical protein PK057_08700, partial [Brevefilum fermentans]|nr:hypothetical protein [Brevefilum fermentans]
MQTRKILFKTLGALIAVAVLLALLPGSHVQGATLCVNPGGTGGCYGDIQGAIDAAQDGDTIDIAAGDYFPAAAGGVHLTIDKSITLIGAGRNATRIIFTEGSSIGLAINAGSGVTLGPVKIQGVGFFNVSGGLSGWSADYPVRIGQTGGTFEKIELEDVRIYRGKADNLHFDANAIFTEVVIKNPFIQNGGVHGAVFGGRTDALTITGGHFSWNGDLNENFGFGLSFASGTAGPVKNILVSGTKFEGNTAKGINANHIQDAVFDQLTVIHNGKNNLPDYEFGISINQWELGDCSNIVIKDSLFKGNTTGILVAAPFEDSKVNGVQILSSDFEGNKRNDISLWDSHYVSNLTILYNRFKGTEWAVYGNLQLGSSSVKIGPNWYNRPEGPRKYNETGTGKLAWNYYENPWCYVADCSELYVAEGGSIQEAIGFVPEGGKVHVGPGTYNEALTLNKPSITVQSTDGADDTIIDVPDDPNSVGVTFVKDMGTVTFDGFTVKNWKMVGITQSWTQRVGTTPRILNNKVIGTGHPVHGNCIQVTGDNALVKGNFVEGAHYTGTEGYAASGILAYLANNAVIEGNEVTDSDAGIVASGGSIFGHASTTGVKITGNTVYDSDECIGVHADAINTVITSNTLHGCEIGIAESFEWGAAGPSNSSANLNKIYDNDIDIGVYADDESVIPSGHVFNASPNWFGSPCGPSKVEGEQVVYSPWYIDEEMTTTTDVPPVSGTYTFPVEMSSAEKNAIIACAAPGTEFTFEKGTHAGGIVIPEGQNELVFNLADGAKFGNNAPCFEVYANDITIEAESKLGAVCYPGSHGVVVGAGVDSFELINLEIDGTNMSPGNGVHFEGAVSNVWLVNNFIHDIKGTPTATGNGVFFTDGLGGFHNYIQGNLFHNNDGNGIEAGTAAIDARYNAWGHFKGAEVGDGFSSGVEWQNDHTHVDLYLVSSGTHYPNQVVKGEDITYTIKGSLANIQGMEFTLTLPEQVSYVAGSFSQLLSGGFSNFGASVNSEGNLVIYAFQYSETGVTTPVNAEDEALFEFKLSGVNFGKELAIGYINTNFSFAHQQGDEGPTNNVYPTLLLGIDDLEVIDLPKLSQDGLTDPLTVGIEREFTITLENPEEGGVFEHTLIYIFVKDAKLDDIYSFVCYDEDDNPYNALLSEDGQGNLVGTWGPPDGFELTAPYKEITKCEVTFKEPGEYEVEITLVDEDTDWELARLEFTVVVNAGDFSVTGTVSMQGRTLRSGVPMTLTSLIFGDFTELSGPTITDNLLFEGLNGGDYLVTTLQERYLNIHEGLNKTIYLNGNVKLPLLHLF